MEDMDRDRIIQVLDKWNFWNKKVDTGIKRKLYLKKIISYLSSQEIIALTGIRRSGKSTILLQIIEHLISNGVLPKNILFVNFEEPFFEVNQSTLFLNEIFDAYLTFFNPHGKIYLFLDEVQHRGGWEKFVVSLYDRKEKIKIFVTGSSSKLLQSEIATLLSGRYFSETVYPLSFGEFLDFKDVKFKGIKHHAIYHYLQEYIEFGGFPRVVLEKDKIQKLKILEEYYSSIVEKDVILRNKIKNVREIKELLLFLFSNIGSQISTYNIEKTVGISNENTRRYIEYFKEAFLLDMVDFFSYKVKKQIYNPKKIYSTDTGLATVAAFRFSENKGRLLENVVFNHLKLTQKKIFYWKNKSEADFITRKRYLIDKIYNVCWSLKDKKTVKRELESLKIMKKEFGNNKATIIFLEKDSLLKEKYFVDIIDFLLKGATGPRF